MIGQLSKTVFLEMIVEKTMLIDSSLISFFDEYDSIGTNILSQINAIMNFGLSILTNWIYNYFEV